MLVEIPGFLVLCVISCVCCFLRYFWRVIILTALHTTYNIWVDSSYYMYCCVHLSGPVISNNIWYFFHQPNRERVGKNMWCVSNGYSKSTRVWRVLYPFRLSLVFGFSVFFVVVVYSTILIGAPLPITLTYLLSGPWAFTITTVPHHHITTDLRPIRRYHRAWRASIRRCC